MTAPEQWQQGNDEYLAAALAWLRLRLRWHAEEQTGSDTPPETPVPRHGLLVHFWRWLFGWDQGKPARTPPPTRTVTRAEVDVAAAVMKGLAEKLTPPPALVALGDRFGLSEFERSVLLLCAAMELDTRIPSLCAQAQYPPHPYPTLALAFALFDDPAWDVRSPRRPLFHWHFLEVESGGRQPLNSGRLTADPRIVNYLKGLNNYPDEPLAPLLMPLRADGGQPLPPSQQGLVDWLTEHLRQAAIDPSGSLVQLTGPNTSGKRQVAGRVAKALGQQLHVLPSTLLPTSGPELETFVRLCQREGLLRRSVIYVDAHDADPTAGTSDGPAMVLKRFLESMAPVSVFLDVLEIWPIERPFVPCEVRKPTPAEQLHAWREALGPDCGDLPVRLASQFNLNLEPIRQVGRAVAAGQPLAQRLDQSWRACLHLSWRRFDGLAQRIEPKATWDDLVLPETEAGLLKQIIGQVRRRLLVYDAWGFRRTMSRGLGISVLFHGESGTGKTMAAEVIAAELGLYLCRIDLSVVMNKFIGETEKNLRRLFDAAEDGGAILFFDEADALFGMRSEVKDSHDRYSNIEINYLLQRMETFGGLAILATNRKAALDPAFLRRLRFTVPFGFPGAEERKRIWKQAFPSEVPLAEGGLDHDWLSRHALTGASIKNIAMGASFLAAESGAPVAMSHVLEATKAELVRLERPVREADLRWQPRRVRVG